MINPAHRRLAATALAAAIGVGLLAGCSTGGSSTGTATAPAATAAASAVLPVTSDPISNTATATGLSVTQVLLEDNTDEAGNAIGDRLQVTIDNASSQDATGLEVFYTMTDATTGQSESYYQSLDGLTIPAGGSTIVYFDNGTGANHFPENAYSIYRTSVNQVDFTVEVSAQGLAIATGTGAKSPGTGEQAD